MPQPGGTGHGIGSEDDPPHLEQGCEFTPRPPAAADSYQRSRIRGFQSLLLLAVVPALRQPTRAEPGTLLSARRPPGANTPASSLAGGTCSRTSPGRGFRVFRRSRGHCHGIVVPAEAIHRSRPPVRGPGAARRGGRTSGPASRPPRPGGRRFLVASRGSEKPCVRVPSVPGKNRPAAGGTAGHSEEGPQPQTCQPWCLPAPRPFQARTSSRHHWNRRRTSRSGRVLPPPGAKAPGGGRESP